MATFSTRLSIAAGLMLLVASAPVFATGIPAGSVIGSFSAPILAGQLFDPGLNSTQGQDNTLTAVHTGFDALQADNITWGADPSFSRLMFVGQNFPAMPGDVEFLLGTLFFTNGESGIPTLIFGATFTMSVGVATIDPYIASMSIASATNDAVAGTPGCLAPRPVADCNSDWVDLGFTVPDPLNPLIPIGLSFNVLEGNTGAFELRGKISGDPFLDLTNVRVAPGFESVAFIGHGLADFQAVPEPASLLLLGTGLVLLAVRRRQRKR